MKAYLQAFVNFKQNDWPRLLLMAEFAYNNAKNSSTGRTLFKLNCGYHPRCKTVNLVNTLGWSRGMFSVNGRSHVIRHVLILRIFGASKNLRFRQNPEEMLNRLNSVNWAELHKGHMQESWGEVTCRGHVERSCAQEACKLPKVICIYKWAKFNSAKSNVDVSW